MAWHTVPPDGSGLPNTVRVSVIEASCFPVHFLAACYRYIIEQEGNRRRTREAMSIGMQGGAGRASWYRCDIVRAGDAHHWLQPRETARGLRSLHPLPNSNLFLSNTIRISIFGEWISYKPMLTFMSGMEKEDGRINLSK